MSYFLSHIGYILIVGVVLAALCVIVVLAGAKSRKITEERGYDPELDKSDLACAGCKLFAICSGGGKPRTVEELEACLKENEEKLPDKA